MFSFFKDKKTRIEAPKPVEQTTEKKIKLDVLLDIIKHGDEIGLKVRNEDNEDRMRRVLDLGDVKISINEWSEWTITIELYNQNKNFTVYESPGLKVDWYSNSNEIAWAEYSSKPLEVEWIHDGEWCEYITKQIEEYKIKLDNKRKVDMLKVEEEESRKRAEKLRETSRLKSSFNEIYKNKNNIIN